MPELKSASFPALPFFGAPFFGAPLFGFALEVLLDFLPFFARLAFPAMKFPREDDACAPYTFGSQALLRVKDRPCRYWRRSAAGARLGRGPRPQGLSIVGARWKGGVGANRQERLEGGRAAAPPVGLRRRRHRPHRLRG